MELLGGKSYENGIDFTVRNGEEGYVFSARRNDSDEIKTLIRGRYPKVKNTSFGEYVISAITTLAFVLIIHFFKDTQDEGLTKIGWLFSAGVFWLGFISVLYVRGKNPKNYAAGRYHSVEHKVLNFYEEYSELPRTAEDIEKMSSIHVGCGSTLIVVIALFITFALLSVVLLPTIFLKIVGVIISAVITMYCWANGKCDFAQKWHLKQPTHKEIELAVFAMQRLAKVKSVL